MTTGYIVRWSWMVLTDSLLHWQENFNPRIYDIFSSEQLSYIVHKSILQKDHTLSSEHISSIHV